MSNVIVIGGGPAGMMAAVMAAQNNHNVILIEKNNKLGKKLYITGKGRCNLTNDVDVEASLNHVLSNKKFLYSSFYGFDSKMLMRFFEEQGLKLKVERGDRVFPLSDKSSDVIKTLTKALEQFGVDIRLNTEVKGILVKDQIIKGVLLGKQERIFADKVVVATGGLSYSMTGSTGDGYSFAKEVGHTIEKTAPGLVPLETKEEWVKELQGLSLKNVSVRFMHSLGGKNKVLYEEFGEMLFTHFGLSGPLILSGSSSLPKEKVEGIHVVIDLKPSLTMEQLDTRILRDFEKNHRKFLINALDELLPQKLIPIAVKLSGIEPGRIVSSISKEERHKLTHLLKNLTCAIDKTRNYDEAIITRGGVQVKEIDPGTMESKLVSGLYFVGEVLDLDALTGGFNLQIAFSTGYLAGKSIE